MELKIKNSAFTRFSVQAGIAAMLLAVGMYAYLGWFSRYLSDDYCEAVRVGHASSPIAAVFERYTIENWPRATMRYSNLLFVGFSEKLGGLSMPLTTSAAILLWVLGLTLAIREIRRFLNLEWMLSIDLFLGAAVGYISLLQAPNLFQTIYWRSSMMTHFAPLVALSFLAAFLFMYMRRSARQVVSIWIYPALAISFFLAAGFSEPPTVTMLTLLPLLMAAVWLWSPAEGKRRQIVLLAAAWVGTLLGLLAMILSPAALNASHEGSVQSFPIILLNSFLYSYVFLLDGVQTLPLPSVISVLVTFFAAWLLHNQPLTGGQKKIIVWLIFLTPVFAWFIIAAGFSPSVYGQGYPVERARFLGRTIALIAFMVEGGLLGILLGNSRYNSNSRLFYWTALAAFTVVAVIYPLRLTLGLFSNQAVEFRQRAELWDLRDALIKRQTARGEKELVVPGFSGLYGVKELDDNSNHWINLCAAQFYGADSIRTIPVEDEYLLEALSE